MWTIGKSFGYKYGGGLATQGNAACYKVGKVHTFKVIPTWARTALADRSNSPGGSEW